MNYIQNKTSNYMLITLLGFDDTNTEVENARQARGDKPY